MVEVESVVSSMERTADPVMVPVTARFPLASAPVVVMVEEPVSIVPNPLVIEPLFNAPEVTRAESPLYAVASHRLNAGVASVPPNDNEIPP